MRNVIRLATGIATAALVMVVAVSCDDDDDDDVLGPGVRTWQAFAFGMNERPNPTTEDGTGVALFVDRGTSIEWTLTLDDINAVTASHIHGPALADANAAVIVDLFMPAVPSGELQNRTERGSFTATNNPTAVSLDSLRTLLNNGRAYVNVHTTQFPAGAIRGQIVRTR